MVARVQMLSDGAYRFAVRYLLCTIEEDDDDV